MGPPEVEDASTRRSFHLLTTLRHNKAHSFLAVRPRMRVTGAGLVANCLCCSSFTFIFFKEVGKIPNESRDCNYQ